MGAAVSAAPRLSPRGDVTLTFIHCSWDAMCRLCRAILGQTCPVVSYSYLLLLIPLLLMWGEPELLTPTGSWSAQRPVLPGQCAGPHLQPLGLMSPRIFVLTPPDYVPRAVSLLRGIPWVLFSHCPSQHTRILSRSWPRCSHFSVVGQL